MHKEEAVESTPLLKAQITWRSSYLFACCVFHNIEDSNSKDQPTESPLGESDDFFITYYNVLGNWYRWTRYPNLLNEKSIQTRQRIISFFWESTTVQDFLVIYIVAKLKPTFVDELMSYDVDTDLKGFNTKLNELVNDLLPPLTGVRIDMFGKYKAIRHVLYFEPEVQILSPDKLENYEETLPLLEHLRAHFGLSKRVEIPTILQDMILYPGVGYGNKEISCVAVRLYPFKNQFEHGLSSSFQIPLIPISFLNHIAYCTIKDFCCQMLASSSLSTEQYWKMGKSWSNFVNYHTKYMETRLELERLVLKMEELDATIDGLLSSPHLYQEYYIEFIDKITFEQPTSEILKRSLSTIIKKEKQQSDEQLRKRILMIKKRMSMLDSYLHDAALADSISTNIRLAKSVEKLTWVVIFIALLTFVATLIPDSIKTHALAMMLNGTNIEWLLK
jgi:hypothetical protein